MNKSGVQTSMNIDKDAWIICDSRSHPGLKFYVNKVTGIKVWNITESEIALAEKVGKVGPEPDGSPKMNNPTDQSANIYNKQIINNQFSNQLSNLVLTAPAVSPYPNWDKHEGQPVNMQQQLFNSQGQPVNLQRQYYTLVPTAALTPLLNQAASLQNCHQLFAQTSLHNNAPFIPNQEQYGQNQGTPIKRPFNSFNIQNNDWNEEHYQRRESSSEHTNRDLRSKLISKRRRSCSASFLNNDVDFQYENTKKSTPHETKNKFASVLGAFKLQPLKALTAINSESKQWFIVVEKNIILENYNYLDDMVTADPDCHLVVPHHVMSELKTHVSVSSDVRPRRTLRFLTQQIENGMAMLGEQEEGRNSSHNTILTCVKLASRKNVVILISDDKKTLALKPNINGIHVFTMRAVKDILDTKSTKPTPSPFARAVKINVLNNINLETETRDPENNTSSELFNNYYDQSNSNNEKLYTPPPPITKNGKLVSHIIDKNPKPPTPPVSTISPLPKTKKISLVRNITRNTPGTNSHNTSKVDDKNQHKPEMTNISPMVQEISTERTPDNNSPSSSQIDGNNLHKQASDVVAPQISPTPTTKPQYNINAVDEEDALLRRGTATYIAPTDPNNSNFHRTSAINKPSDSYAEPNKCSPTKPEFASPRKIYNSNWNHTGNMHGLLDTSSTSSTSNISLDSLSIKKIISMNKLSTVTSKGQKDNAKDITPIVRPKSRSSSWTSYDNDNTSEPSLKTTVNKNLVTEEPSNSKVIPNSESFNSHKVITPKKQDVKRVSRRRRMFMYEVTCQSMEEVLRLRSEEWVFRFVQIMEEVLGVKLQEKVPYEQKEPAPWNLQEATRCIIKKFDNHFDVVDAANKLARFLYEISDENGKVINIEPSDYMELYSYGFFLVETFLDMYCTDCKEPDSIKKKNEKQGFSEEKCSCLEVGTAYELLKNLLYDIHNANVETFVDQEVDHPPDYLMDSSVDDSALYDFNTRKQGSTEVVKMKMNDKNVENVKHRYPIRRKQPDTLDEVTPNAKKPKASSSPQFTKAEVPRKVQTKVKAGKSFEKQYFDSLQLLKTVEKKRIKRKEINGILKSKESGINAPFKDRKIQMDTSSDSALFSSLQIHKKDLNDAEKACIITVKFSNKPNDPDEQKDPSRSSSKDLIDLKCHFSNENEKSPSKVVRKFKINEELERRVKAKSYQEAYKDTDQEENMNGEYNDTQSSIPSVDNTLDVDGMAANETFSRIPVDDNLQQSKINNLSIEENVYDEIIETEANAVFQDEIKHMSLQLEMVFFRIASLCDTYFEKKMRSAKCKEKLRHKVNTAFTLLSRLHEAMVNSVNKPENHYECKLRKLLNLENSTNYFTDNRFSLQYRDFISNCTKPAEEILTNLLGILRQQDCSEDITS